MRAPCSKITLVAALALASCSDGGEVLAPDEHYWGLDYPGWIVQWSQANPFKIPDPDDPPPTGFQPCNLWVTDSLFLYGATPFAEHTCVLFEENIPLFFPIVMSHDLVLPAEPERPDNPPDLGPPGISHCEFELLVDGVPYEGDLADHRVTMLATDHPGNPGDAVIPNPHIPDYPEHVGLSVVDGVWILMTPFSFGVHTIEMAAEPCPDADPSVEPLRTTYTIDVRDLYGG